MKYIKTNLNSFLFERNLTFKIIGQDVKNLQTALVKMGFDLPIHGIDSKMGPETLGTIGYFLYINNRIDDLKTEIKFDNKNVKEDLQQFIIDTSNDIEKTKEIKKIIQEEETKINSFQLPDKMLNTVKKLVPNAEAFLEKVKKICLKLKARQEDLIRVMYFESGLSPQAQNKESKATGLIQFMPATAKGLNTTIEKLYNMDILDQLDYVEKYLLKAKNAAIQRGVISQGHILDLGDLYSSVFMPSFIGKKGIIAKKDSKIVKQNPSLKNKEGDITKDSIENNLVANTTTRLGPVTSGPNLA